MCPHDKFDYFFLWLPIPIPMHQTKETMTKKLQVRVCQNCHEPEVLTDENWMTMLHSEDPCQKPSQPA